MLYNPDINIVIRTSDDQGKTWSAIKRVVDFPDQESASDVSMVLNEKTKEIYLFYNYMNHKIAKNEFRLHFVKVLTMEKRGQNLLILQTKLRQRNGKKILNSLLLVVAHTQKKVGF